MIELPEALTIARQMNQELKGKRIASGLRGNSPHRFAFYSGAPDEYQALLKGKLVGEVKGHGSAILADLDPDYVLVLGGGGERIFLHQSEETLPKKHQLLICFEDNTYLTVTVQGWGNVLLLPQSAASEHPHVGEKRIYPHLDEFTFEHLLRYFQELGEGDPRSVKFFIISDPGIWGVGNGYLQDILYRAKIHPRRRAVDLTEKERWALFDAIKETLCRAVDLGGRESERDLYNQPGGYKRLLDNNSVGQPCGECGTPIEKIRYLGGACYFCPACQA